MISRAGSASPACFWDESRSSPARCCSRRPSGASSGTAGGPSAADVALQLLDGLLLLLEHRAHQITDREYADHTLAIDHGQMPDALLGHDPHAVAHGLVGLDG